MPTGGGINFATTRPTTLTADDGGYTMVDTTTRELIRWNGTVWVVLLGGAAIGLKQLSANLDIYINPNTGDDSFDGSSAKPFKTISKAVRYVYTGLDLNNFSVIIHLSSNTNAPTVYPPQKISFIGYPTGFGPDSKITLQGDLIDQSSMPIIQVDKDNWYGVLITSGASVVIRNIKLQIVGDFSSITAATGGLWVIGLYVKHGGSVDIFNVDFGNFATGNIDISSFHMRADASGSIWVSNGANSTTNPSYYISGGATVHATANASSNITYQSLYKTDVKITNSCSFVDIFQAVSGSEIYLIYGSWTSNVGVTVTAANKGLAYKLGIISGTVLNDPQAITGVPGTAGWVTQSGGILL